MHGGALRGVAGAEPVWADHHTQHHNHHHQHFLEHRMPSESEAGDGTLAHPPRKARPAPPRPKGSDFAPKLDRVMMRKVRPDLLKGEGSCDR